ncbi:hypothetical protein [Croceicoccus sp. Ery15]|uniref:hypothetical protein n=1 Tax=Croceicoccus sp. Ery15 TaxID=1703338 RepID=UPI001E56BD6B|nr:hypothetical protein [Croceicoccus sp. Ery15]
MTSSIEGFSERVRSQNTIVNTSKVDAAGSHQVGQVAISASVPQVLTPTQLADVRSAQKYKYIQAHDAGDIPERTRWAKVSAEFEDEFSVLNEVIVFKVQNDSRQDVDASAAKVLLVTKAGARVDYATFSSDALELLNDEAFLLDRESSQRITYTSGKLGSVPALSTRHFGVIVPHMNAGEYEASVSNFPGAKRALSFDLIKR